MIFIKDLGTRSTKSNRTVRWYLCRCQKCGKEKEIRAEQYRKNSNALCQSCSAKVIAEQNRLKAKETFIQKAKEIHGNKYDYSSTNYIKNQIKVEIFCNQCKNVFTQRPADHKRGVGCPNCKTKGGWSYTDWVKAAPKNAEFKVYIIECWNDEEHFIKIGRTFNTLIRRFAGTSNMNYEWKLLKEFIGSPKYIYDLETQLHQKYKDMKYRPQNHFHGITECYSMELKEKLEGT